MAFRRATLPAVLSLADKPMMIGITWNTYLIVCKFYIYYIAFTGAPFYSNNGRGLHNYFSKSKSKSRKHR